MIQALRLNEYKVLFYRILLGYIFYFISRVLFFIINKNLFEIKETHDLLELCYHGLVFDTTALLYINGLFILLSVLPLIINTTIWYQKCLMWLYFTTNLIAYCTNFIDIIYYRFSQTRSTYATLDMLIYEDNKSNLLIHFLGTYWYILNIFICCCILWLWLYKKVMITSYQPSGKLHYYFSASIIGFVLITGLVVGGIRGDFKHSTRPINLVDAYRHVTVPNQGDVILNTPFSIIRTLKAANFKEVKWVNEAYINENIKPIKHYKRIVSKQPNVVILILESIAREYWGSMNPKTEIPKFKSYTPFLDSLSSNSLIFINGYANGRQSIHALSSILAGIPSFKTAFTSSPYAKQKIESVVSISEKIGYQTSFYHGAANGSMGFLGFCNILGVENYYGRTEYNNDDDFDGIWGIWDEPFFQYIGKSLGKQKQPFLATVLSLSSHDPFKIPIKYEAVFKGGPVPIDKCVEYTDYALKKYFDYAKKQPWYKNTIFVITADHTNQSNYEEYQKPINRFAVPILFFSPNKTYQLKGTRTDLASQTDIFPTIVDLIGYNKPFRSWGRSLVTNNPSEMPRVINSPGNVYQFMQENYSYIFDGEKFTGVYNIEDKGLTKNLLPINDKEVIKGMSDCKAYIQDYMGRIINRKLTE